MNRPSRYLSQMRISRCACSSEFNEKFLRAKASSMRLCGRSVYSKVCRRDAQTNDSATSVRRHKHAGFDAEIFDGQCTTNTRRNFLRNKKKEKCLPQWRGLQNIPTVLQELQEAAPMSALSTVPI